MKGHIEFMDPINKLYNNELLYTVEGRKFIEHFISTTIFTAIARIAKKSLDETADMAPPYDI